MNLFYVTILQNNGLFNKFKNIFPIVKNNDLTHMNYTS